MYLLTISRAAEDGHEGPLGLAALAEHLGVSSASANEMVRKMAGRDLVTYEPYKGASLTPLGSSIARRVLRTRRLWARFLADHLGFTPREADAMACDLEHVTTADAAERLAEHLGHPGVDPLGRTIPAPDLLADRLIPESLAVVPPGTSAEVVAVTAGAQATSFLEASGIHPGEVITVIASGGEGVLVSGAKGEIHLDRATATAVTVRSGVGHAD